MTTPSLRDVAAIELEARRMRAEMLRGAAAAAARWIARETRLLFRSPARPRSA